MIADSTKAMTEEEIGEFIRNELGKCASDVFYFIDAYCFVKHPIKGKLPFNLFEFQHRTLKDVIKHRLNIILKARQLGITTLVAVYALWLMIFHKDKEVMVVSTKLKIAKGLIKKVKYTYKFLPSWMQPTLTSDNVLSLEFHNGSQIQSVPKAEDAARSESLSLLILDEAAFIKGVEEVWKGAASTIATGGAAIVLSTPNGVGNWFWKMYSDAENQRNGFNFIKLKWDVHPERDQAWRAEQTKLQGERESGQENDCDFVTSGNTVIDGAILKLYMESIVKEPIDQGGFDQNLQIWKNSLAGRSYIISADVATGHGGDYSAAVVLDNETMEVVADYQAKVDTQRFGEFLVGLGIKYNDALLVIENNAVGLATIQTVINLEYPNLYWMEEDIRFVDRWGRGRQDEYENRNKKKVPGFTTSIRTRPLIIDKLQTYFRDGSIGVFSKRIIDELMVFVWLNGKAVASSTNNDDMVMALSIGLWVRDTALKIASENMDVRRRLLDLVYVSEPEIKIHSTTEDANDPYKINVGVEERDDIRWLF